MVAIDKATNLNNLKILLTSLASCTAGGDNEDMFEGRTMSIAAAPPSATCWYTEGVMSASLPMMHWRKT